MTPAQWERLKALFLGAMDQPAASRDEWLARAAGGDGELLREAAALLDAHDTAHGFLEEPASIDPADVAEPELVAGSRLGAYVLQQEIGRGGMGIVYLAEDQRLGRRVAVKSLPPSVAGNAQLRERLRREARAAATIAHPNIAVVYALEEIDDHLLLVTEYIPGETLRAEMDRGQIAPARALVIATEITAALAAAHDVGVVHRDLKPENVMITAGGGVKVVDFGIASVEHPGGTRLTVEGALIGTPAYMAPEQLAGRDVDPRADIYAAGIVLVEMITGRHPLAPDGGLSSLPPAIAAVAAQCLQQEPAARYTNARHLALALEQAGASAAAPVAARDRSAALWWWECHQAVTALTYWLLMIPAWIARGMIGGLAGRIFFFVALAAVVVAGNLRLHLWFTSRWYAAELRWLRGRVRPWIAAADWVFALALIAGGLIVGDDRAALAVVLLSFGLGAAVGFLFIEPATARAAFRK